MKLPCKDDIFLFEDYAVLLQDLPGMSLGRLSCGVEKRVSWGSSARQGSDRDSQVLGLLRLAL